MIATSATYKNELSAGNGSFYVKADFELWNGDKLSVDNQNIMQGGFRIKQAVSGQSAFEIGTCVINELTLVLNNMGGTFDGYDFADAEVVASFGLYGSDGVLIDMDGNGNTTIQKGVYYVDEIDTNGSLITLTCLDAMAWLDMPFANVGVAFPATLQTIVQTMCNYIGLPYTQTEFHNSTYVVNQAPEATSLTCRDVLSMVCEIACCYGTINTQGQLVLDWYNVDFMRTVVPVDGDLDGGSFWDSVSSADGGSFWDTSGTHDAGTFVQSTDADYELSGFYSFNRERKDVVVSGVKVGTSDTTYLAGSDEYALSISQNALINTGTEGAIAIDMASRIADASFRPFDASHLSDPTIEPGDTVTLTDHFGNTYRSVITQTEFSAGEAQDSECNAESPTRNRSTRYTSTEKATSEIMQVVNDIFARDVTVTGQLHSEDYIPAESGASPPYAQRGLGIDFAEKEFEAENFAVDANGKMYANGCVINNGDGVFAVDADGKVTASNISITGGSIELDTENMGQGIKLRNTSGTVTTTFTAGTWRIVQNDTTSLMIQPGGGITTAGYLNVAGNSTLTGTITSGGTYSNTSSSGSYVRVLQSGQLARYVSSSRRYKHDITDKLDKENDPHGLYDLRVKQYKYNDDYLSEGDQRAGQNVLGFIAEEVAEAMPNAVDLDENGQPEMWNVHIVVPAMLKLIQEQKQEIDELKERLERLEARFMDDGR